MLQPGSAPAGSESTATVTVTVTGVNDAPVTTPDSFTTTEDTPLASLDVLANDSDPDGDSLSISGTPVAGNGTVTINPNGTLAYTPNTGFTGTDQISYTISDGNGGTDTGSVTVTVEPAVAPTAEARNDSVSVNEHEAAGDVDLNVLSNDGATSIYAINGSTSAVGQSLAGSNGGLFTLNADGSLDFDAAGQFEHLGVGESLTTSISYSILVDGGASTPLAAANPADGITISVLAIDPASVLPTSGSFVASAAIAGPLDDGTITITDTVDLTFSDDNNGRETATSSGAVGGRSWSDISTDNEYQWLLENSQTGERITVFQVEVEGSVGTRYWGATGELQAGVSYSVVSVNSNPSASQGVPYDTMLQPGSAPTNSQLAMLDIHDSTMMLDTEVTLPTNDSIDSSLLNDIGELWELLMQAHSNAWFDDMLNRLEGDGAPHLDQRGSSWPNGELYEPRWDIQGSISDLLHHQAGLPSFDGLSDDAAASAETVI